MKQRMRALLMSALSLLLCISMLLGTTWAWFTDSATSSNNKIQSGNLKVDLELLDKDTEQWNSLKNSKAPIFNYDRWEPGYVDAKILKIENEGTLALKWVAKFYSEIQLSILADVIDVYVCSSETEIGYPTDRDLEGYTCVGNLRKFINSIEETTKGTLEAGKVAYLGIALKMNEKAGNEYQGLTLGGAFDIRIFATQWTGEEELDSFGNQYDKDATFDDFANTSILATETKTLVAGEDSVEFDLSNGGLEIAKVTVPADAILDPAKPVTVTFDGITPSITGENIQSYAYDIKVTNLKSDLTGDQLVTVVVEAPKALAAMQAYHNGVLIEDAVYDEVAGTVTFKTASFSPYDFTANVQEVSNLDDLREALQKDGYTAKLIANIEVDLTKGSAARDPEHAYLSNGTPKYYNGVMITGKNVGLDLNGHSITAFCGDAYNSNSDVGALFFVGENGSFNITNTGAVSTGFIKMRSSIYAVWAPFADPSYVDIYGGAFIADSYAGDPVGTPLGSDGKYDRENGTMSIAQENSNRSIIYAGYGGNINVYGGYFLYNNTINDKSNRNNGAFNAKDYYEAGVLITIHDGVYLSNKEYRQNPYRNPETNPSFDDYSIKLAKDCDVLEISESVKIDGTTYDTWYRVTSKQPVSLSTEGSQTLYAVGDTLNLSVKVNYAVGSKTLEAGDYTLSAYDMSFGGKKYITITYTENEKTFSTEIVIDVKDEFSSIIASPKKQTYNIGDTVSKSDFTVSAVSSDGSSGAVGNYTISNVDTSTTGVKKVTISYVNNKTGETISTTCEINVLNLKKVTGNQVPTVQYWHAGNFAASNNWNHVEVPGTGYESYVGKTYTGANGEISSGFNLTGHTAAQPMSGYNNLTVTNATPHSLMGINGTIRFENATIKSMGYYVDGDLSTIKTTGTINAGDKPGAYIVQANLYDFTPGSTHTITFVVEVEAGFIDLCQWTVTMAEASNDAFVDTDKPNVNVIIIAGQSNACGASPITQSLKNQYSNVNYQNVFMQYKNTYVNNDGTIGTACESAAFEKYYFGMGGFQSQHFGPEAGLAYYLATNEATKNEQWFIVKYAATGTTITQWVSGVKLANELVDFVEGAIEPLTKDYDVQIRSLLWMQGETDACEESWANAYKANEQQLVTYIRNALDKYATRIDATAPGSGISFIGAAIAQNSNDGWQTNGLVGNEVANGGRNDWEYSATVNWSKHENAQYWYLPVVTGGGSVFGEGIAAGWYGNAYGAPGIINSAYIDTYTLISKNEAPDAEKAEYVVATDPTDWAHYSSASMIKLGTWFGEALTYVAGKDGTSSNSSATTSKTYTVTYNGNGGTISPDKVVVAEGKAITLLPATRTNYTFKGWSDGSKTYAAGAEYTVTGNVTLIAQWDGPYYAVTYNANGGSVNKTSEVVSGGSSVTLPTPTATSNLADYRFRGWSDGTNIYAAGASYTPTADVTLTAQWRKLYKVTENESEATITVVQGTEGQNTFAEGDLVKYSVTFEHSKDQTCTVKDANGNNVQLFSIDGNPAFYMPASNVTITASSTDPNPCITSDTLVMLADGTQKRADQLTYDDQLLVWNFFEGKYDIASAAIIFYHGDDNYRVISLNFEDGTTVKVIGNHAFYDVEENEFVYITEENAAQYVGDHFVKVDGDGTTSVKLVNYEIKEEYTGSYSVYSSVHVNFITEGMFSLTPAPIEGFFDTFTYGENMKYDEAQLQADIARYGLYEYEVFAPYGVTYEQYVAFNMPYLKFLVGRGDCTFDDILMLLSKYVVK